MQSTKQALTLADLPEGPIQATFTIDGVKLYLIRKGNMSGPLADDLMHWANRAFVNETGWKTSKFYPYRLADTLLDILSEDRFTIFNCEICEERTIVSELTEDERELFPSPNEPDVEDLVINTEWICADCQAARCL